MAVLTIPSVSAARPRAGWRGPLPGASRAFQWRGLGADLEGRLREDLESLADVHEMLQRHLVGDGAEANAIAPGEVWDTTKVPAADS